MRTKNLKLRWQLEQDVCVWVEKSSSSAGTWLAKEARHEFGESGHLAEQLRSWLFLMPIFTAHAGNLEARGEIARGWVAVAACCCCRCYDTTALFGWTSRTRRCISSPQQNPWRKTPHFERSIDLVQGSLCATSRMRGRRLRLSYNCQFPAHCA